MCPISLPNRKSEKMLLVNKGYLQLVHCKNGKSQKLSHNYFATAKKKDEPERYKRPITKTAPFYIYTTDGSLDGKFCLLSLNVRQFIFAKGLTTRHLPLAPLKL